MTSGRKIIEMVLGTVVLIRQGFLQDCNEVQIESVASSTASVIEYERTLVM